MYSIFQAIQRVVWRVMDVLECLVRGHPDLSFVRNIHGDLIRAYDGRRSIWRCTRCHKSILSWQLYKNPEDDYSPARFPFPKSPSPEELVRKPLREGERSMYDLSFFLQSEARSKRTTSTPRPQKILGMDVIVVNDTPKYVLPEEVLPGVPWPPGFRDEFNAWSKGFLGATNVLSDWQAYHFPNSRNLVLTETAFNHLKSITLTEEACLKTQKPIHRRPC